MVQLDALGTDGVRVRIAPPGGAIVEPPLQAFQSASIPSRRGDRAVRSGAYDITNGNLQVTADPVTGLVTAIRVSDGAVLLKQVGLTWGAPAVGSRPNSTSATVTFAGTPGELVYGLGEHRTGTVQQMPFFKLFQDSQYYPISHGAWAWAWACVRAMGRVVKHSCERRLTCWAQVGTPWSRTTARRWATGSVSCRAAVWDRHHHSPHWPVHAVWNLPSYGWVNLTTSALAWHSNATLNADFWITTTPSTPPAGVSPYALLLHNMVDVVGHAPPMPQYASGFIQCKDRRVGHAVRLL